MHDFKMLQTGINKYIVEIDGKSLSCRHVSFDVGLDEAPIVKIDVLGMANAEFEAQVELDDEFVIEQVCNKMGDEKFMEKLLTAVEKHRGKR